MKIKLTGRSLPDATLRRLSIASKKRWKNPAYRKHMSEVAKRQWTPEYRRRYKAIYRRKKREGWRRPPKINRCKKRAAYHYWLLYRPYHPYANKHGWIYEHRLVMEAKLGRYLKKHEVVHHKNGKKGDNRIQNLQLFANQETHIKFHRRHF